MLYGKGEERTRTEGPKVVQCLKAGDFLEALRINPYLDMLKQTSNEEG